MSRLSFLVWAALAAALVPMGTWPALAAVPAGQRAKAAEARIERALKRTAEFKFVETPLDEVVDYLEGAYEIPILIAEQGLHDAGIEPTVRVSLSVRNLTLASALNLMLRQLDLTWTIADEALLVTTPERQDYMLVTRVYPVDDLVGPGAGSEKEMDALIRAIRAPADTHTWSDSGKPGSVWPITVRGKPLLVVSQPVRIQREVAALLHSLREAAKENAAPSDP